MDFQPLLTRLVRGQTLPLEESEALFHSILRGELDDVQIAAVLTAMQTRLPTVDELTGAAQAMRSHVTPVRSSIPPAQILDTCGTGGTTKTFNVSTAAAIVAAATGLIHVAKHGNRSRSGRGSAEALAALGVNIDASPAQQARCLEESGVCFCFAIHHHPAMKHAGAARRSLGIPTIFNLLGPLTNPAGATRQMVGVYRPEFTSLVALTLGRLGCSRAVVVHGTPEIDEVSICGPTRCAVLESGSVRSMEISPAAFGMTEAPLQAVSPGTLELATQMLLDVLGGATGPARDMVILSTAAALLAGTGCSLAAGASAAKAALDSGAALATLRKLAATSHLPE